MRNSVISLPPCEAGAHKDTSLKIVQSHFLVSQTSLGFVPSAQQLNFDTHTGALL